MSLLTALLVLVLLALVIGLLLGYAQLRLPARDNSVIEQINRRLPQTQCGQCGYPGCRPYAEAIAAGDAHNKCPPGGATTLQALSDLLGRVPLPLDAEEGASTTPRVAFIREAECIGCTRCIQACPVDAILGATRLMHTVIAEACTGCDLCIDPCPVDCIDLLPLASPAPTHVQSLDQHESAVVGTRAKDDPTQACIRCGDCASVCPMQLLPQQLYFYAAGGAYQQAADQQLFDCIECGACHRICPSDLPLVESYRAAKTLLLEREAKSHEADQARQRFEARQVRLQQEAAARQAQRLIRTQALASPAARSVESAAQPLPSRIAAISTPEVSEGAVTAQRPASTTNTAMPPNPKQLQLACKAAAAAVRKAEKSLANLQAAPDATPEQLARQQQRLAATCEQLARAEARLSEQMSEQEASH